MKTFVLAIVAALALLVSLNVAEARGWQYGMVTIVNHTGIDINYQFKWGDGDWVAYTVKTGQKRTHWYHIGGRDFGPSPRIRFDYDLSDAVSWRRYLLHAAGTNDTHPDSGRHYEFRRTTSNTLDLSRK